MGKVLEAVEEFNRVLSETSFAGLKKDPCTHEWTVTSRVRKLVSGPKRYIRVRGPSTPTSVVGDIIRDFFPHAYMTSGSYHSLHEHARRHTSGAPSGFDLTFAEK